MLDDAQGAAPVADASAAAAVVADQGSAATPAPAEAGKPDPAKAEPLADDALLAIVRKHRPERSDDGKFAGREQQTDPNNPDQSQTRGAEQTQAKPAATAIGRPTSWSADKEAIWATVPPEAQAYVAQRETEAQQAISRMGNELAGYRPLGELLNTHAGTFDRHGVNVVEGIDRLLAAQQRLDDDPAGAIVEIAGMYGVDLGQLAGGAPQQPGNVDPTIAQLQQQLAQLQRSQAERDRREQQEAQRQNDALQGQVNQDLARWSADKAHFGDVRQVMAAFIANGQARTLDEAYDMAIHAVPTVRAKVMADQRKAEEAARLQQQQQAVGQAKRDGALNVGSRRGAPMTPGSWDDDEALKARFAEASRKAG